MARLLLMLLLILATPGLLPAQATLPAAEATVGEPGTVPSTLPAEAFEDGPEPILMVLVLVILVILAVVAVVMAVVAVVAFLLLLLLVLLGILSTSAIAGLTQRSFSTALRWFVIQAAAAAGGVVGLVAGVVAHFLVLPRAPWWIVLPGGAIGGLVAGGAIGWLFVRVMAMVLAAVKRKLDARRQRSTHVAAHFPVEKS